MILIYPTHCLSEARQIESLTRAIDTHFHEIGL